MNNYTSDRQINQLEPGATVSNTDLLAFWTNQGTVRMSASQFAAYIAQGVPNPPSLPAYVFVQRTTDKAWSGSGYLVEWQTASGSAASAWDVANPTRLTVPTGYTHARFTGNHRFNDTSTNARFLLQCWKNGGTFPGTAGTGARNYSVGGSPNRLNIASPIVPVTPGDYFEMRAYCSTANGQDTLADDMTWAQMEFFN